MSQRSMGLVFVCNYKIGLTNVTSDDIRLHDTIKFVKLRSILKTTHNEITADWMIELNFVVNQ